MARQVDVKALISHIVRGDGADKCRICMGDTSEGQVYLGDTVMMDGDKPVTLSELLETITGVEVALDWVQPAGLCLQCSLAAINAAAFRTLCRQANNQWHNTVQLLENLPDTAVVDEKHYIQAVIEDNQMTIIYDQLTPDKDIKTEISDSETPAMSDSESGKEVKYRKTKSMPEKNCECQDCGKTFSYALALFEHLMESTDVKRACYICTEVMSRDSLVRHLKTVHKKGIYECKKCPALLPTRKQFKRHISKAHSRGAYSCMECNHTFTTMQAVNAHSTLHISKNCPSCDKLFRNRRCYTYHVKKCCNLDRSREDTHHTKHRVLFEVQNPDNKRIRVGARGSADKECICDYCGKTFAGKKFVCAHIQIVHMKNTHTPCPYCGKSYAAAHMTSHIKKHVESLSFTCEQCGVTLKSRLGYMQHIRLHTGEKPYRCKYCSETFSASSRRSEHIRKIHKIPEEIILKHACNFCPARFRLPYRLRQHLATVHEEKNKSVKEYKCATCHINFSSVRGLLYHSKKHQTVDLKAIIRNETKSKLGKVNVEMCTE